MTDGPPRLVVASTNQGKIVELTELLGNRFAIEARPTDLADTIEDGETLEANAAKKAMEVAAHVGAAALADDTGLFVDALDGLPGVRTARYAGPDGDDGANVTKLLAELADVRGPAERRAAFRTVIVFDDGRRRIIGRGEVVGHIATERRGPGGFGYDPVFVPSEGDGSTFAEMDRADKNSISHRARALADLLRQL